MGRLDEQAKKRIIELRKAGLSFRKIKTVLEVDNIKVTAQAVYLFLKRKKINPVRESGPVPHPERRVTQLTGVARADGNPAWENQQLWNLMHENNAVRQTVGRAGEQGTGPQSQQGMVGSLQPPKDNKDGIRIVSVTSLSNGAGQFQLEKNLTNSVTDNLPCSKSECVASPPGAPVVSGCGLSSVSALNTQQQQPKQPVQVNSEGKAFNMVPKNTILLTRKKLLEKAILLKRRVSVQNSPAVSTPPAVQRFPMSNHTVRQPISTVQRNSPTMTTVPNAHVPATSAANSHLIANSSAPQQVMRDGQAVNLGRTAPSLLIAGSRPSIGPMGKDANSQPVLVTTNTSAPVQNFLHSNSQMAITTATGSSQFTVPTTTISMSALVEKLDTVCTEIQNLTKAFQSVVDRQSRLEQQQEQQQRTQQDILAALQQLNFTLNANQAPLTQNCMSYNNPTDAPPPTQQFGQYKMELF
ncbi:uncharacterized protein LOC122816466 [Protopterus annectens]|uniref:uncharacterized protein LOC122816466 n=1 Tax=Protopterus annectens TaxID=7888 RepID=UPI001CFB40FD|nr:uncharacterized protein LOC122816466 [Protopterus annectens]XP_043945214.1 uncharacterized protein LOC122816466 [Protopterus annectens]